jgi:hypothetical protein
VIINTIHCGDYRTGVSTHWKEGADIGKGKYMNINTDERVIHIKTPWDTKIIELNIRLNKTYLGYGQRGKEMKVRQEKQDANAAAYGEANVAQRAAAKAKVSYKNSDWDIVDAVTEDEKFYDKVKEEELPIELKGKSKAELKKEVEKLKAERTEIQKELRDLEKKMDAYILEEKKKQTSSTQTLDNVLIQAVMEQAKSKGFDFSNM